MDAKARELRVVPCDWLSDGLRVSKKVEAPQVINLNPGAFEKSGAMNDDRETLRTADGDVESIWVEEKFCPARRFCSLRGRHRSDDDRGLLPLELVNGADLRAPRQKLFEEIHLQVIGSDNEDVGQRQADFLAVAHDLLGAQLVDEVDDGLCFGAARLRAPVVPNGNK
jgi:hypothetical protein